MPPRRLYLISVLATRGTVLRSAPPRIRTKHPIFVRVLEHAAAVIIDKGLRQRALSDDYIVSVEFDVEIFDLVDMLRLGNRYRINQVLGLDQHAFEVHGVMR